MSKTTSTSSRKPRDKPPKVLWASSAKDSQPSENQPGCSEYEPLPDTHKMHSLRGIAASRGPVSKAEKAAAVKKCESEFGDARKELDDIRGKWESDLVEWERALERIEKQLKTAPTTLQLQEQRLRMAKEIKHRVARWCSEIHALRKGFMQRWQPILVRENDVFMDAKVLAESHLCLWFEPLSKDSRSIRKA